VLHGVDPGRAVGVFLLAVTIAWSTITVAADADIVFAVALGYALGIYSMWALRRD